MWALHGWAVEPSAPLDRYYQVVAAPVAAGSAVEAAWLEDEKVRADGKMTAALTSKRETVPRRTL